MLEDHTKPKPADVVTTLVTVNIEKKTVTPLVTGAVTGANFYSSPKISPDGKHISFVQWFHPDMPWEGGETVIAPISSDNNGVKITGECKVVAGRRGIDKQHPDRPISSQQPEWIPSDKPSDKLLVLVNQSGFLIPYTYILSTDKLAPVLSPGVDEDFGDPAWNYGNSSYAILDSSHVLISSIKKNAATLYLIDLNSGTFKDLNTSYVDITRIRRISDDSVVFIGKKLDEAQTLVQLTGISSLKPSYDTLKKTSTIIDNLPGYVSEAKYKKAGPDNKPIYCTYYSPRNPDYEGKPDEKPPCIVHIHGGPTSRDGQGLDLSVQFFTSRGFSW